MVKPQLTTDSGNVVKHSKISKLRSKKSPVDEAEWENTLSSTLLPQSGDEQRPKSKSVEKLELTALVAAGQLSFVIRRNISGITQRLGEITLKALDDEEAGDRVELLDWLAIAVDRTASLEKKVEDLGSKYEEQGNTIQKLNQQLDELIEAKKEHEALLLEKFQALLNAKKLKIRDQQRLLASAKVDPQTGANIPVFIVSKNIILKKVSSNASTGLTAIGVAKSPRQLKKIKKKSQWFVTDKAEIRK